jgi:hypothetical protein
MAQIANKLKQLQKLVKQTSIKPFLYKPFGKPKPADPQIAQCEQLFLSYYNKRNKSKIVSSQLSQSEIIHSEVVPYFEGDQVCILTSYILFYFLFLIS